MCCEDTAWMDPVAGAVRWLQPPSRHACLLHNVMILLISSSSSNLKLGIKVEIKLLFQLNTENGSHNLIIHNRCMHQQYNTAYSMNILFIIILVNESWSKLVLETFVECFMHMMKINSGSSTPTIPNSHPRQYRVPTINIFTVLCGKKCSSCVLTRKVGTQIFWNYEWHPNILYMLLALAGLISIMMSILEILRTTLLQLMMNFTIYDSWKISSYVYW